MGVDMVPAWEPLTLILMLSSLLWLRQRFFQLIELLEISLKRLGTKACKTLDFLILLQ